MGVICGSIEEMQSGLYGKIRRVIFCLLDFHHIFPTSLKLQANYFALEAAFASLDW